MFAVWPSRTATGFVFCEGMSHIRTVGLPAAATNSLSGEMASLLTCFWAQLSAAATDLEWAKAGNTYPLRLKGDLAITYSTPCFPKSDRMVI